MTRIRRFENSSAIDRGTVPELKSDEFLDLRILVIEIRSILSVKPQKKCYTYREPDWKEG